jgi:aspartate 1-decarboxylase
MIKRTLLRAKIHRAVVTHGDVHYIGSLTIDEALMEAADLHEFELVQVADVDNGSRLETYVIKGERGTGIIGANGAAARLLELGDRIIIMAYAQVDEPLPEEWSPRIVLVNDHNQIEKIR